MGSEIKHFHQFSLQQYCPQKMRKVKKVREKYGKKNIPSSSVSPYFGRSRKPCSPQNSKHGNSEFTQDGKIMGNHKYSKGFGFLYIPQYSISFEIETHTIPKTWEITEFSQQGKRMGKHKHSKAMGFLHILCVALIHTIPKI